MKINSILYNLYKKENEIVPKNSHFSGVRESYKRIVHWLVKKRFWEEFHNFFLISKEDKASISWAKSNADNFKEEYIVDVDKNAREGCIENIELFLVVISKYDYRYEKIADLKNMLDDVKSDFQSWITNKKKFNDLFLLSGDVIRHFEQTSYDNQERIEAELLKGRHQVEKILKTPEYLDLWNHLEQTDVDFQVIHKLLSPFDLFSSVSSSMKETLNKLQSSLRSWNHQDIYNNFQNLSSEIKGFVDEDILKTIGNQIQSLNDSNNDSKTKIIWKNISTVEKNLEEIVYKSFIKQLKRKIDIKRANDFMDIIDNYQKLWDIKKYYKNGEINMEEIHALEWKDRSLYALIEEIKFEIFSTDFEELTIKKLELLLDEDKKEKEKLERLKHEAESKHEKDLRRKEFLENIYGILNESKAMLKKAITAVLAAIAWFLYMFTVKPVQSWFDVTKKGVGITKKWYNSAKKRWSKAKSKIVSVISESIKKRWGLLGNTRFASSLRDMMTPRNIMSRVWHNFILKKKKTLESQTISWFEILNYDNLDSRLLVWETFYKFRDGDWEAWQEDFSDVFSLQNSSKQKTDHSFFLDRFDWSLEEFNKKTPIMRINPWILREGRNSIVTPRGYLPVISKDSIERLKAFWISFDLYCIKENGYFYLDVSEEIKFDLYIEYRRYWDREYNGIFFNTDSEELKYPMVDKTDLPEEIIELLSRKNEQEIDNNSDILDDIRFHIRDGGDRVGMLQDIAMYLNSTFLYSTLYKYTVKEYDKFDDYISGIAHTKVGDCKNVNSLNIALYRLLGEQAQELAWYVKNDEKYSGHAITEVNIDGKSKLVDATPSKKKSDPQAASGSSVSSSISLPKANLPGIKIGNLFSKFDFQLLNLPNVFIERYIEKTINKTRSYISYEVDGKMENMKNFAYVLNRIPNIKNLKNKVPLSEYREELEKYYKIVHLMELKISNHDFKFHVLDKDVDNIVKESKAMSLLEDITWKKILRHELYYHVYSILDPSRSSSYHLLEALERMFMHMKSKSLSKKINALWLDWIYEVLIPRDKLKEKTYVEYCFYPYDLDLQWEVSSEELWSWYKWYDQQEHEMEVYKSHIKVRKDISSALSLKPYLKNIFSDIMLYAQNYWIILNSWTSWSILDSRLNIISEWTYALNTGIHIDKYVRQYWEDGFIAKIRLLSEDHNSKIWVYQTVLSHSKFLEDIDNIIFLHQVLRKDIKQAQDNYAQTYAESPRQLNRMVIDGKESINFDAKPTYLRERNYELDNKYISELNSYLDMKLKVDILMSYALEDNPKKLIEACEWNVWEKERLFILSSLWKINSQNLRDYQLWLDLLIDRHNEQYSRETYGLIKDTPLHLELNWRVPFLVLKKYHKNLLKRLKSLGENDNKSRRIIEERIRFLQEFMFR